MPARAAVAEPPAPVGSPWRGLYLVAADRLAEALKLRNPEAARARGMAVQARDLAERAGRLNEIASVWLDLVTMFGRAEVDAHLLRINGITIREPALTTSSFKKSTS